MSEVCIYFILLMFLQVKNVGYGKKLEKPFTFSNERKGNLRRTMLHSACIYFY